MLLSVMPVVSPEASAFPLTSDFVLAATKGHRDRLVPFCVVDPRASYTGGSSEAEQEYTDVNYVGNYLMWLGVAAASVGLRVADAGIDLA